MKQGGYRPGAGRPRKGEPSMAQVAAGPRKKSQEYLMDVMNDPNIEPARRDRAAIALLPYQNQRIADARIGKKELAEEAARTAGQDSEWGDDLRVN